MDIWKGNKLVYGGFNSGLKGLRSFFRPFFDNGSSQTAGEREFEKNLASTMTITKNMEVMFNKTITPVEL